MISVEFKFSDSTSSVSGNVYCGIFVSFMYIVIRTKTFKSKQISVIKKIQLSRTNGRVLLLSGLAL